MYRIVLVLALAVFARGSYVDQYVGQYVLAATLPKNTERVPLQDCSGYKFAIRNTVDCECQGRKNLKLLELTYPQENFNYDIVIVDVTQSADVEAALNITECECGGVKKKHFVFRRIDDNLFAYYDTLRNPLDNTVQTLVSIFAKTVPQKGYLEAALQTVDDLKNKSRDILCSTN